MPEKGNGLSRNPNLCAACSTIVDEPEAVAAPLAQDSLPTSRLPDENPQPLRKAA